jgi:hypothetical protein
MSSFQNPVGSGPKDPFDKTFRIEPIEEDKLTKGDKPKEEETPPSNEKLGIASSILQLFHSVVDYFLSGASTSKSVGLSARDNLLLLRAAFETLKREDRSQDVAFLNQLSKIWRFALENAIHFKNDHAAVKFKVLVKKIQHYPENQPHTFGYYLTENADQKWVPFPYMDLVTKIHTEHGMNGDSALTDWTNLLDEIVSLLKDE